MSTLGIIGIVLLSLVVGFFLGAWYLIYGLGKISGG